MLIRRQKFAKGKPALRRTMKRIDLRKQSIRARKRKAEKVLSRKFSLKFVRSLKLVMRNKPC